MTVNIPKSIPIVIFYSFPYVFVAAFTDYVANSMYGYLLMVIVTTTLAYIGKRTNNTLAIVIGNGVSAIVSFYFFTKMAHIEHWGGYFKPLMPIQLFILVSLLNILPQVLAIFVARRFPK